MDRPPLEVSLSPFEREALHVRRVRVDSPSNQVLQSTGNLRLLHSGAQWDRLSSEVQFWENSLFRPYVKRTGCAPTILN